MDLLIRDVKLLDGSTGSIGINSNRIVHVGAEAPEPDAIGPARLIDGMEGSGKEANRQYVRGGFTREDEVDAVRVPIH